MKSQPTKATLTLQPHSEGIPTQLRENMEQMNEDQSTNISNESADCLIENGHQVKQWDAINLNIWFASKDGIQKAIGEISFPHLKSLSIYQDKISSIEMLGRLNAHNLQAIVISNNKIMTTSQLRKSNKIQRIRMVKNVLNDAEYLTEGNWSLEFLLLPDSQNNISFCAKFKHENNQSYKLWIDHDKRIPAEKKQIRSLIQKYSQAPSVEIRTRDGKYTKQNQPQ